MARYNVNNSLGFEILSNSEVQNAVDNDQILILSSLSYLAKLRRNLIATEMNSGN